MIRREIETEFRIRLGESPAILVTGPRQSGKTTLCRGICEDYPYFSFEDPLVRALFHEDPRGFLHQCKQRAIFDEAQHVPQLFSFLQGMIDEDPRPGRFVITGSQQFGLTEGISQSLAGRVGILELLPFSCDELNGENWLPPTSEEAMWTGGYPPIHHRSLRPERWFSDYVTTYIQRDIRQITQVQNLNQFTQFIQLCAGNTGQLFNASRIGSDCGVDQKTVRNWMSILDAGYVATLLQPYHQNFRKRIVKTPKIYFYDTGLICHLLGIHHPDQLVAHPLRGAIFENWVFGELVKLFRNRGLSGNFWFWRTHGGQEVDFIVEHGGVTMGIEVKSGMSVQPSMLHSLKHTLNDWPTGNKQKVVVYGGLERMNISDCTILPWREISSIAAMLYG